MMFTIGALLVIASKLLLLYANERYVYKIRPRGVLLASSAISSLGCGMMAASILIMAWGVMP
jgi:vacuolar-type H+-ATPase subunit I/STV1